MKLIYKKNLATVALIWTGCFILLFLVYMFVLVPQRRTKESIENELVGAEQLYQSALKAAEQGTREKLEEQIEQLQSRMGSFAIDINDSANLTFDIGNMASEQGIASFSVKSKGQKVVTEIPDCEYIGENHIDISFSGQFNQFVVFLNELERHRPVIFVDEFTVTRSRHQAKTEHRASLSVAVFVKK